MGRAHPDDGALLGFAGLSIPFHFPAVLPAVEVGWRLRRDVWGRGYATEAGRVALATASPSSRSTRSSAWSARPTRARMAVAARLGLRERERVGDVVVLRALRPG